MTALASVGGSAVVAGEVARGMADRGHDVHVVTDRESFAAGLDLVYVPEDSGVEAVATDAANVKWHIPMDSGSAVLGQRELAFARLNGVLVRVLDTLLPEVINVHYAVPGAWAAIAARNLVHPDARVVVTCHGTDVSDPPDELVPMTKRALRSADRVTVVSKWLGDELAARYGVTGAHVVPNWRREIPVRNPVDRRVFGVTDDEALLVHVSNFRPVKQAIHCLAGLEAVLNTGRSARLVLVGSGPDLAPVLDAARTRGLGDRVISVGVSHKAPSIVAAADVCVMPSRSESFGLVALDAAAAGVPYVGYDVGGLSEVVRHGTTGLLGPLDDQGALGTNTVFALSELFRRRTHCEGPRVAASFDKEAILDQYTAVFADRTPQRLVAPPVSAERSLG